MNNPNNPSKGLYFEYCSDEIKQALDYAVSAIYFADSSDYLNGLYGVVSSLTGLNEPSEEDIKTLFKQLNSE